ncbi:uncharacterized protein FRV6_10257 [Fusarium oxysporum]|uniref:Uncharacterized protein n=1 Tax=Fusarium oxysporum TaxID=5507 RepID=A0A2H3TMY9_FUSOX|nr:uncharacterized protein FRV6_10257 [Fusarium oxysporum]
MAQAAKLPARHIRLSGCQQDAYTNRVETPFKELKEVRDLNRITKAREQLMQVNIFHALHWNS